MKSFLERSLAIIIIIAICALIQILVGITWWKVILVSLFLIGISWLKSDYKYRAAGKVLFWIVIVAWGYHLIMVEIIDSKFSLTNEIRHRTQVNNDYKVAESINPEMLLSKVALLEVLNHKQDSLGILMEGALYAGNNQEANRLLQEQMKITKEIRVMKESIKEFEKKNPSQSGVNSNISNIEQSSGLMNPETISLESNDVQGSRLSFKQDDLYKVIALEGDVVTMTLSGSRQLLEEGHTYRVHIKTIKSGPLFFHSENGGKIVIEKQ